MPLCWHLTHGSSGRCQLGRVQKPRLTQTGSQRPQPAFCRRGQLPRKGQPQPSCLWSPEGRAPASAGPHFAGLAPLLQAPVHLQTRLISGHGRGGGRRRAPGLAREESCGRVVTPEGPRAGRLWSQGPAHPDAMLRGTAGARCVSSAAPGAAREEDGPCLSCQGEAAAPADQPGGARLPQVLAAGSRAGPPVCPLPLGTRPLAPSRPPFLAGSEGRSLAPG